jgi:hypothetical protein
MEKLIWKGNYCYPELGTVREYNDRIQLEIECVRSYPMPSDKCSVKDLEEMGLYGLYKVEGVSDVAEFPCPHCAKTHSLNEPCSSSELYWNGIHYETTRPDSPCSICGFWHKKTEPCINPIGGRRFKV